MQRYTVHHRYASWRDGVRFGPWRAGEQVELSTEDADWVNRDSPGCLVSAEADAPVDDDADAEAEVAAEGGKPAGKDRMHRGARTRGAST